MRWKDPKLAALRRVRSRITMELGRRGLERGGEEREGEGRGGEGRRGEGGEERAEDRK